VRGSDNPAQALSPGPERKRAQRLPRTVLCGSQGPAPKQTELAMLFRQKGWTQQLNQTFSTMNAL
jgi:hypothetical protein